METYPVMIDGELAGKLTVDRQGGRTVFDAECKMRPDLVRISVYGGGQEGYLGVLAPEDGKLRLHKTLSRGAMRDFPGEIDSVERSGMMPEPEPEPAPAPLTEQPEGAGTPHAVDQEETEETEAEAEPPPEEDDGLSWYSSPDGALVCFDGTGTLIALPPGDARVPDGVPGRRRTVEGKEYLVYRTKDGRIVK